MSNIVSAIATVAVPLLALLVPGIVFIKCDRLASTKPSGKSGRAQLSCAARTVLWSMTILTLGSFVATVLHLSLQLVAMAVAVSTILVLVLKRRFLNNPVIWWQAILIITIFVTLYGLFSIPFLLFHDGLPTGDVQKAILWAQHITEQTQLPDYSLAHTLLNRDPVDFYTPGLHTLTSLIMQITPNALMAIGFLAIASSLALALIGAAIARLLFPKDSPALLIPLTVFLILTNLRWLRYLREPGYHFQNVFGELFLFGALFLILSLISKWQRRDLALLILVLVALALTHQFSTFIALFLLAPPALFLLVSLFTAKKQLTARHLIIGLVIIIALIVSGFALGLQTKIPHIFTSDPHLISLIPDLLDYSRLMGLPWLLIGLSGLTLIAWHNWQQTDRRHHQLAHSQRAFILSTFVLLLLSQAPRLFIDIPPARALFYVVVPLSICGAYFITRIVTHLAALADAALRRTAIAALFILLLTVGAVSTSQAYQLSHDIRTNSTLTGGQLTLIDYIRQNTQPGEAIITDDYNRRASSWLILSGQPLFNRIAADLERQMAEASQSGQRYQLYLKQLDYEKIYSLGSLPEITQLLDKHNAKWLVGITRSSHSSLRHNRGLVEAARADDMVLYKKATMPTAGVERGVGLTSWLLRSSTVANDIGDREDTFAHLPASLRTARLSEPLFDHGRTYRITSAPLIPLRFNIGDYTQILWDQERTGRPDTAVELLISLARPSPPLTIRTSTNHLIPFVSSDSLLKIEPQHVPIDEAGFITIIIENPSQQPLAIDLIALGLARTP